MELKGLPIEFVGGPLSLAKPYFCGDLDIVVVLPNDNNYCNSYYYIYCYNDNNNNNNNNNNIVFIPTMVLFLF